ncbi:MAG: 3-methyladenine glycosylase [Francisellaceae bacterium]|nr:3-methyladenine glycosylase [Francisellaceae bacterium]
MALTLMKKLKRTFFNQPTLLVAEQLLGKILVFKNQKGMITETEAYLGLDDPASHAFKGKTPRTEVMFGKPGFSYVYLIYGMYYCLNFVTEREGFPAGVLIRGVKLLDGSNVHLDGPGKLCRGLGITTEHNKVNITTSPDFYVACMKHTPKFKTTPRIGIKVGLDKHWRFVAELD